MLNKVRMTVGGGVSSIGAFLYVIAGLVALGINLMVVMEATGWGFWAVVLGVMFFPVTIVAGPWYALLAWGNPLPLAIGYGGLIVAFILGWLGALIGGEQ